MVDAVPDPGRRAFLFAAAAAALVPSAAALGQVPEPETWRPAAAARWYGSQRWPLGCNFIPSSAVNQLEMWQAESFDPAGIERELGWAADLGMNTIRVFLHDLPWQQDASGFRRRIDRVLAMASGRGMRVLPVLFDSCWDPFPRSGPQSAPVPGVHNSRWVQSPGALALQDKGQRRRLRDYVEGIIGAFGHDARVLAWDLWNEPDNLNPLSYGRLEPPRKLELVEDLLPEVFAWARRMRPVQPLTSGVWQGDWSDQDALTRIQRIQLDHSDLISFHSYDPPDEFSRRVHWLRRYHRPILCTEYMARPRGSTFERITPLCKALGVAAINWGLVAGRTQTWLPWESWRRPEPRTDPQPWFHDVFHPDGTPYRTDEAEILRRLSGP